MAATPTVTISAQFDQQKLASSLEQAINKGLANGVKFKVANPFEDINKSVRSFEQELDRANQRVITLGSSFLVLSGLARGLKDVVNSTILIEKSLTDINAVFQLSSKSLDTFSRSLFNVARNSSQTFEVAADAAKEFSRQGLGMQEVLRRTNDALILSRQSGIDVAESVGTITTALNTFQKEALTSTELVNKLANADAAFAVTSKDLAEAITRVGSSASDAGVSFDELISLVTTAKQITGRDGAAIAQALNSIFTRINRKGTIEDLKALGVETRDVRGEILPTVKLLDNFAHVYENLTGTIKNQAAETVGGVRNLNTLKGVLGDLTKSNSLYSRVQTEVANSTDQATIRNEALNQSLDSVLKKFNEVNKQVSGNVGRQVFLEPAKGLIGGLTNNPITAALQDATGNAETTGGRIAEVILRGIGKSLIYGLGPILIASFGKIVTRTIGKLGSDFGEIAGITKASNGQKTVQEQIVALYLKGDDALKKQLATMTDLVATSGALAGTLAGGLGAGGGAAVSGLTGAARRQERRRARIAEALIPIVEERSSGFAGFFGTATGDREAADAVLKKYKYGQAGRDALPVPLAAILAQREQNQRRLGFGVAIGAPLVAGLIPEGAGGTGRGQALAATSGALTGAGFGASIGSLFPDPRAAGIGAAVGAFVGGITGFVGKLNKSFEELAKEIDESNKKIGEEFTAAAEAFRIQDEIKAALLSGASPEKIRNLENQFSQNISKIKNEKLLDIVLSGARDPNARNRAAELAIEGASKRSPGENLRTSFASAADSVSHFPLVDYTGQKFSSETNAGLIKALGSTFSNLSLSELEALGQTTKKNPLSGIAKVTEMAGLSEQEQQEIIERSSGKFGRSTGTRISFADAIFSAIEDAKKRLAEGTSGKGVGKTTQDAVKLEESLEKIAAAYREQANVLELVASATDKVNSVRQQIVFSTGNKTEAERLALTGQFDIANISTQFGNQGRSDIFKGKSALTEIIRQKGGDTPEARTRIENISSLSDLGALQKDLSTTGGRAGLPGLNSPEFEKALADLINTLQKLKDAETLNTGAALETNELLKQQLARSQTLEQAIEDNSGSLRQAATDAQTSIDRRNPQDVTNAARLNQFKLGFRSQVLDGSISEEDANVGQKLIEESTALDSLIDSYKVLLRVAKERGATEEEINNLLEEQYAANQKLKITVGDGRFGPISPFQGAINTGVATSETDLKNRIYRNRLASRVAKETGATEEELSQLGLTGKDLENERQFKAGRISEGTLRLRRAKDRTSDAFNGRFTSGSDVESSQLALAREQGLQGDSQGSFFTAFGSKIKGFSKDLRDLSVVGEQVGASLSSSLSNAFGDFVTGAKNAKDAFRSFILSLLGDSARAFATKAVQQLLGLVLGSFGLGTGPPAVAASGGYIGLASGGSVPALLTGGEYVFSAPAAARLGPSLLNGLNRGTIRKAGGGAIVTGGSGMMDDVPARLAAGSFVVRKAMAQHYGTPYLSALAAGSTPSFAIGGSVGTGSPTVTMSMPSMAPLTFAGGGSVPTTFGGGVASAAVSVTINDNRTTTSTSTQGGGGSSGGGGGISDPQFAQNLARQVERLTLNTLQTQQRVGGMLRPQSNLQR